MDSSELKYWIAFGKIQKLGPMQFKKIYQAFPMLKNAWEIADFNEYLRIGFDHKLISEIFALRKNIDPDAELEQLARMNIKVVTIKDQEYPKLLKEIYNPPPLLYYKGVLPPHAATLAVVGTRKVSSYGIQATTTFVEILAQSGVSIISGLALGIDTLSHQAAIRAHQKTFAILGSGIDKKSLYPPSNYNLAEKIIDEGGGVLSEFPPNTAPLPQNFPQRNRIISGLSLGVFVVEAPLKSGALITAQYALEQNREIFALPGNVSSKNSYGTNMLIKQGAYPVTSAQDILEILNLPIQQNIHQKISRRPKNQNEEILLKHLNKEPMHIDQLIATTRLNAAAIYSTLTIMELDGMIINLGGGKYILA